MDNLATGDTAGAGEYAPPAGRGRRRSRGTAPAAHDWPRRARVAATTLGRAGGVENEMSPRIALGLLALCAGAVTADRAANAHPIVVDGAPGEWSPRGAPSDN